MNKEDKITFDDLANWLDKPLSNNDIDLINFILTSIENRYKHLELQQKVNQLETNRDEAIELLSKGVAFCKNDSQGAYDVCNIAINREKKAIEILERGKE